MLQGAGDSYVHLDKVSTSVSLDELTHSHKAHTQPGLPPFKGQRDKALLPQESYSQWRCHFVNSRGSLCAQFRGASLPLCAIKETGRHLDRSVCEVHRCNKCHSAGIQTGCCSTALLEYSHQYAKNLEFINVSKIKKRIFQQKLPWQDTVCDAVGDTSDLLWCPLSHLFACRQNQETACFILVSIWTYRSMPMFSSDLLYGRP